MKQDNVTIYSSSELTKAIEDVRKSAGLYLESPKEKITVNEEVAEDERKLLERNLEMFDAPSDTNHLSVEFVWNDQRIGTLWLEFWVRAFSQPVMYTVTFNKANSHLPADAPHPIRGRN